MKRGFCKFILTVVVTTTFLSGCNSAQLRLNSDDDANTEESTEDISEQMHYVNIEKIKDENGNEKYIVHNAGEFEDKE